MKQQDLLTQCPSVEIFQRINLKLIDAESDVAPCRHADPLMNRSALHHCILIVPLACFPECKLPLQHSIFQATVCLSTTTGAELTLPLTL